MTFFSFFFQLEFEVLTGSQCVVAGLRMNTCFIEIELEQVQLTEAREDSILFQYTEQARLSKRKFEHEDNQPHKKAKHEDPSDPKPCEVEAIREEFEDSEASVAFSEVEDSQDECECECDEVCESPLSRSLGTFLVVEDNGTATVYRNQLFLVVWCLFRGALGFGDIGGVWIGFSQIPVLTLGLIRGYMCSNFNLSVSILVLLRSDVLWCPWRAFVWLAEFQFTRSICVLLLQSKHSITAA